MQLSKREEEKNSHMAAGFVSSIIRWTAEKFSSLIPAQTAGCSTPEPCTRASEDFEMLQKTMLSMKEVLENTEEKDMQSFSEKLRLEELSGAARDAEDVLEEYEYEVLRAKVIARRQVGSGRKRKFEEVCETSTDDIPVLVPVPNDLTIRMKEIKKRFDTITKEWDTLRLRESDGPRRRDDHAWTPKPTSSLLHEPNVHGREKDKEHIIQMLLEDHENSRNSVSVLPIVGMGGIGKTTLAQLVYNDPRVCHRFRQKGWVCVSEDFDVLELARKIFASITKRSCCYTELNEIVDALREELMGKRFLLVLDDVWNDNLNLWTPLRDFLFALEPGKIIVTTRNESTAKIMQTVPPHRLDRLGFALQTIIIIMRDDIIIYPEVHVDVLNNLFRNLKRLRTLNLRRTRIGALPESIGNLKLLRYLDIGETDVKRLPESIFGLYNLQTLGIKYDALEESPEAIKELINLRHLLLKEGTYPKYLPSGIRHLTKLQTLTLIHLGRESRHFKIQDLKNLAHLKGSLLILNLKNVTSVEDAEQANLKSKKDLKLLDLSWKCSDILYCNASHGRSSGESSNVPSEATSSLLTADWFEERVLASLEPHTNLEEFIVSYYGGIRFPRWVGDASFTKLVKIILMNCQKCILLPPLGQLPSLRYLSMSNIESLQHIGCEFYGSGATAKGFPSLETAVISSMDNWVEWGGGGDGDFPHLRELIIAECPKLRRLPQHLYSSLTQLVLCNCEKLDELPMLPSLTHLTLRGDFDEKILSSLRLHFLHSLEITGLKTLPVEFRNLYSLKKLCISQCYELEKVVSLSELPSLEELSIWSSPQVQFRLHSSEDIITGNCPSLQEWCRRRDIDLTYSGTILYKNSTEFLHLITNLWFLINYESAEERELEGANLVLLSDCP
ncbi:putative disease resistance protein [Ananas comosus]|uniref:Putative disease resistance protein n=1 Tax=Ananas comosus TaxID=4615 RepID=A0A199V8K5_ANACO|nr:putative disease resistance protein [Ananas comosus]